MDHPILVSYLRWIVLFPLIGAIINGVFGALLQKRFGKNAISIVACSAIGLAFIFAHSADPIHSRFATVESLKSIWKFVPAAWRVSGRVRLTVLLLTRQKTNRRNQCC